MKVVAALLALAILESTAVAAQSLKYIGCYKDAGARVLPGFSRTIPLLTNNKCIETCASLGYRYAATQFWDWCFCGDEYNRLGEASNCNAKCRGNPSQICGGTWANAVYEVPEPQKLKYIGCYKDAGARVLPGFSKTIPLLTNNKCIETCGSLGYRYAATQYWDWCFCGDKYDTLGEATNCNAKCRGNPNQICGGTWANAVYEVQDSKVIEPTEKPAPRTIKPTKKPVQTPAIDPTERPAPFLPVKPTEKPAVTCEKQRAKFASANALPEVDLQFTDDCQFHQKQCEKSMCYCVNRKTGKRTFGNQELPVGQDYDCSKKPKKCLKKRFAIILKEQSSGKATDYIPECDKKGKFAKLQCMKDKTECWCSKGLGKEVKNSRKSGPVQC